MEKILFVCTGNIFRSMSAHLLAEKQNRDPEICFASAGTRANPLRKVSVQPTVIEKLAEFEIDIRNHQPAPLTEELINEASLVIAMAESHQEYLKNEYGCTALLFRSLAEGIEESVADVPDLFPDGWQNNPEAVQYMKDLIQNIKDLTPDFLIKASEILNRSKEIPKAASLPGLNLNQERKVDPTP